MKFGRVWGGFVSIGLFRFIGLVEGFCVLGFLLYCCMRLLVFERVFEISKVMLFLRFMLFLNEGLGFGLCCLFFVLIFLFVCLLLVVFLCLVVLSGFLEVRFLRVRLRFGRLGRVVGFCFMFIWVVSLV